MRNFDKLAIPGISVLVLVFVSGCSVPYSSRNMAYSLSDYNIGRSNFDADSPELAHRVIILDGGIHIESANTICKQLIYLNSLSQTAPITLWLNSTGGDMTTFLQIANTIKSTPAPVNVVNTGLCASAAVGLMQGATGKRYAFSDSYFILHGCAGGAKDLRDRCNEYIEKLLKEKTQIPDEWMPFGGNEHTLSAKEALEYGIIDEVVDNYNLITNDTELKNKQ